MPSSAIKAIFTKTFVAISLINMLGLAGYYAIFVVSTQFLSEVFHASTAVAGLATGIIVIGCLVGRFLRAVLFTRQDIGVCFSVVSCCTY